MDVIVMIIATLATRTTTLTKEEPRKTLHGSTEKLRVQLRGKDIVTVENLREIKTGRTNLAFTRHGNTLTTTDTTLGTHRATTTATASLTRPTVTETKIDSESL